jgi:aromatic-L-amino-acid decarboxylase
LFEVIAGPSFALVVLRVAGGADEEESNLLTKRVYDAISAEGEFFLTSSVLKGLYAIRVCVSGTNVGEDEVRRVFDALVRCTEEVTGRKKHEAA